MSRRFTDGLHDHRYIIAMAPDPWSHQVREDFESSQQGSHLLQGNKSFNVGKFILFVFHK